ncbi:DHS-like NAD/FAD-binding domain-containing protein [Melampsora americana]|nr:DHS-like NAD/FAD-binding domain-containing protein [Melampsora americana]
MPSSDLPTPGPSQGLSRISNLIQNGKIKKVIIMAGAGISTSAGIPDFRSPETGLYANLEKYDLPYPEAIFDMDYFIDEPEAFYTLAKELCPGRFKPTMTHRFMKLLENKGILKRVLTQNVDTLERLAGVSEDLIVEAHGSFAEAHCLNCRHKMSLEEMKPLLAIGEPIWCQMKSCKQNPEALVKPDIVFFGESLPPRFFSHLSDLPEADLLIVLGTSLQVQPFASLVTNVTSDCIRLLINLERVGDQMFDFDQEDGRDILFLGPTDDGVKQLCELLGWMEELKVLCELDDEKETTEMEITESSVENQRQSDQANLTSTTTVIPETVCQPSHDDSLKEENPPLSPLPVLQPDPPVKNVSEVSKLGESLTKRVETDVDLPVGEESLANSQIQPDSNL